MAWYDPSDWSWTPRGKRKERRKAERDIEQAKERRELAEIERKRKRAEAVQTEKPPHYKASAGGGGEEIIESDLIASMIMEGLYTDYWMSGMMPMSPIGPRLPMLQEPTESNTYWNVV